jgi:putative restriction endonuclease
MNYWWVNHKQTFRQEFGGKYVWCPKRNKNGARNHFYETLREVQTGDLVISYAFAAVQGFGIAQSPCYSCPKPGEFGGVGDNWNESGWRAEVKFTKFVKPIRTAEYSQLIAPLLAVKYAPLKPSGLGNESYFAKISRELAVLILDLADPSLRSIIEQPLNLKEEVETYSPQPQIILDWEDRIQAKILERIDVPETTRRALVDARRGQGRFRNDVLKWEHECRITHVTNPTHLIASHIKPWREAEDGERLSAANGLMLTPSIDHLFDKGFISFSDDGEVLVSPSSDKTSLSKMGVVQDHKIFAGRFNSDQKHFLDYHRDKVFLKSAI